MPTMVSSVDLTPRILDVVRRYWGYDQLRDLQADAISAGIEQRDSLVVLPTGGGKSLCYQVPPIVAERLDVVVSPLISLMKDQVDGLRANGYPAAAVHSNLTLAEREEIREGVRADRYRLLFISPERLMAPRFLDFFQRRNTTTFAIDEAHCISQWGHDFRPEYRKLSVLKERFPEASVHAYTATATERVRKDIVQQLGLKDPSVLVGRFDRPNLVYRIIPSSDVYAQVLDIVRRHSGEAVIVYCISRKDTEAMASVLSANGIRAAAYHAGLDRSQRGRTQEAFSAEQIDVVAATVAFGMGIDRSNVRCVIHAAMPKSLEHYQQETGRAGRDGLEAECVLLYSSRDVALWQRLIRMSAEKAHAPAETEQAQLELLDHIRNYCRSVDCRHRALSRHFGQSLSTPNCGACDVCLGEIEGMAGATEIAQKVLSCIYRLQQQFGVGYVTQVLRGADTQEVRRRGHHTLSTYGILRELPEKTIMGLIYQLLDQGLLQRTPGDRPVLQLSEDSFAVLRGGREVHLLEPRTRPVHDTELAQTTWEGVDEGLFEKLREARRELAQQRQVPAYVILNDNTLRELARQRPTNRTGMHAIPGISQRKMEDFGDRFMKLITEYCVAHELPTDRVVLGRPATGKPNPVKQQAMQMLAEGVSVEEVVRKSGRARSTVMGYLAEHIENEAPERVDRWVSAEDYERVREAAKQLKADRMKPIHEHLNREVDYGVIRIVLAHLAVRPGA